MSLVIAYEDESLCLIDKPQGLATAGGSAPHLCAFVFARRPELAAVKGYRDGEGGLLNRLDNDTGGLVLFAKTDGAFAYYAKAMKDGLVTKQYAAVVHGTPAAPRGTIELPVGHSAKSRRRMAVADGRSTLRGAARPALTEWRLVERRGPYSLLSVSINKGVRHQIRVHLAAVGLPIVGDKLYNRKGSADAALYHLLYCRSVRFPLPGGGMRCVEVDVPFMALWKKADPAG